MFEGELQGLTAILATNTLRVPRPKAVIDNPRGGAVLIMEYLDMKGGLKKYSEVMGMTLARLIKFASP
jgi:protein-ribulosamine 3-kinase